MASNLFHSDQYPCPLCSAHFGTKEEQADHLSNSHDFETPWICHKCPTSYPDEERFSSHIRHDHPPHFQNQSCRCDDRNCSLPPASDEMDAKHRDYGHTEDIGSDKRQCQKGECNYTNDSYVGLSLHELHLHSPIYGSQASNQPTEFYEMISLPPLSLEIKYQHQSMIPMPSLSSSQRHSPHFTEHIQISSPSPALFQVPPQNYPHARWPQVASWPKLSQSGLIEFDYQALPYLRHDHPTENTIDPRLLTREETDENALYLPSPKLKKKAKATKAQNAKTMPAPPLSLLSAQPSSLPSSIYGYGFEDKDFDPFTVYTSTSAGKNKFKPFPPDLPEEHIFHADPAQIAYDNLLRIASKYSISEIHKRVNEGRPEPVLKSQQVIESRIRSALAWKAEKENVDGGIEELRRRFAEEREKHGTKKRAHESGEPPYTATLDCQANPATTSRKRVKLAPRPSARLSTQGLRNDAQESSSLTESVWRGRIGPAPYPMANPSAYNASHEKRESSVVTTGAMTSESLANGEGKSRLDTAEG